MVCAGIVLGGGGATGMYSLGPGSEISAQVRQCSDNLIRLSTQLETLTRDTTSLAGKVATIEEDKNKGTARLGLIEHDLMAIKSNTAQDAAAIRATMNEQISRIDRELLKLSEAIVLLRSGKGGN